MSAVSLALVLAAAICHATWNLVAKRAKATGNAFVLSSAVLVGLLWAPLAIWVGWGAVGTWGSAEWLVLLLSAVLHVAYFRILLHGYAVADLSVVYPVARGSGPLLSSSGALLVLNERLSLLGAVGAVMVVLGVFLIAGGPSLWRQAHDKNQRQRLKRGLFWGASTGVFIAGYTLVDGYAVKLMLLSPILVDYVGNALRIPIMLPVVCRNWAGYCASVREHWKAALVVAVLGPLSYVMVLYAMRITPLSHVAPAREVSMLLAALAGGHLLDEADRWPRLIGAACIALGVVGLALG